MALGDFCMQYFLLSCFIILGLSGIVVCSAGTYFVYQFSEYPYPDVGNFDNAETPSVILLCTGLLTLAISIYFWRFIGYKYNYQQCILYSVILILVASIEAASGIWALIKFEHLEALLLTSLEQTMEISKEKYMSAVFTHTEIVSNCCGYNETLNEDFNTWLCCDFQRLDNSTKFECKNYYGTECTHMAINRHRYILHRVFLLALSSVFLQLFVVLIITKYYRSKKDQINHSRRISRRKSTII